MTILYGYNKNGAMKFDWNSGISLIQYNRFNLPEQVTFRKGHVHYYNYDTMGEKRQVRHITVRNELSIAMGTGTMHPGTMGNILTELVTDYFVGGSILYEDNQLKMVRTEEGYLTRTNGVYTHYLYVKDHLGNNRTVICPVAGSTTGSWNQVQEMSYYPFGMPYPQANYVPELQPFKFGDKELDEMHGLNWYSQGARPFGAILPITPTPDPHAENYYNMSQYAQWGNNPVNRIDPDGMDDYSVNKIGQIELIKKTEDEMDKLIALGKNDKIEYNDDGNMTNASFDVDKGILGNQKEIGETTYMSVKGNEQAEGIFTFLSENTEVEWGRLSYGKSSNYLSTNNDAYDNGIETVAYDKFFRVGKEGQIKLIDHSHPNGTLPSGFGAVNGFLPKGQGDKAFAEWMYKYFPATAPSIKLRVYDPIQKIYIQYNNKKIITK